MIPFLKFILEETNHIRRQKANKVAYDKWSFGYVTWNSAAIPITAANTWQQVGYNNVVKDHLSEFAPWGGPDGYQLTVKEDGNYVITASCSLNGLPTANHILQLKLDVNRGSGWVEERLLINEVKPAISGYGVKFGNTTEIQLKKGDKVRVMVASSSTAASIAVSTGTHFSWVKVDQTS